MGVLLFVIAVVLLWILSPIFIISAILLLGSIDMILFYFRQIAISIDQLGNVMGAPLFNKLLIKKDAPLLYGNPDETISHVNGVNYLAGKLTVVGKLIAFILNKIDKNHVQKAAENE